MKTLITTSLILFTSLAMSNTIKVSGQDFEVKKLGNYYLALEKDVKLTLTPSTGGVYPSPRQQVDCNKIDETIADFSSTIEKCIATPNNYRCRRLKRVFKRLGTGNSFSDGDIIRYWGLGQIQEITQEKQVEFRKLIAKKLNTSPKKILFQADKSTNLIEIVNIDLSTSPENSRMKKLFPFIDTQDLYEIDQYGVFVKTKNRILTCDLLDNSLKPHFEVRTKVWNKEVVSKNDINIGYKVYEKLLKLKLGLKDKKEIQAAYLGYAIGKELEGHPAGHEQSIKRLFTDLISLEHKSLEVKKFRNRSSFEWEVYPDQTFEDEFIQSYTGMVK